MPSACKSLVGISEQDRPLGPRWRRWQDNTKIELKKIMMWVYGSDSYDELLDPMTDFIEEGNNNLFLRQRVSFSPQAQRN